MKARQRSATKAINADPERIFDLLADPAKHPLLDGSNSVLRSHSRNPERLSLGATFGMDMRLGAKYRIQNTVVEFEENRLIAWRHFNGHRWRWQLKPLDDGGTEVTETFDWSTARFPLLIDISFFPKRNQRAIERTLNRLPGLVG